MRASESESTTGSQPPQLSIAADAPPRPAHVHDAFDALADAYRRQLLAMLGGGSKSVSELAANLPISRPAVSRHLKVLTEAGLVAESYTGTRHMFRLRPEGVGAVQDYLESVWGVRIRLRLASDRSEADEDAP